MKYSVLDKDKSVLFSSDKKEECVMKACEFFMSNICKNSYYVVNANGDIVMDFISIK